MVFTTKWFDGYIPFWEQILSKTKTPERVLEIGSFEGRSACWLAENTNARITCVDTWEGSPEHPPELRENLYERFIENITPYKDRITPHRGYSGEVLRTFPCTPAYDFIYIDGSHYSKDVLEDAVLSWRLLEPGGIMVFDDFTWLAPGTDNMHDLRNPRAGIEAFCSIFRPEIVAMYGQLVIKKPA